MLAQNAVAEKGYISDGAREYSITKLADAVNARRLEIGSKKWNIIKGRKDNLCISYVDSELKSGAALATDLTKRMRPGKAGDANEISNWLKTHAGSDPLVVLLDDFSGTGKTMVKGFAKWRDSLKENAVLDALLDQGRVICCVLFAFEEAVERIQNIDRRLISVCLKILGPEVRAFDPDANLFSTPDERNFGRDVVMQTGRELSPQMPLGHHDQAGLVVFHDSVPNNTLPIFWSNGRVNERNWMPLFSRA